MRMRFSSNKLLIGLGVSFFWGMGFTCLNASDLAEDPGPNLGGYYTEVNTQSPVVALTFDDGPHPEFTPRLLDILSQYGVRATFFVIGNNVVRYPEITQRIVDEGHQLANHSISHPAFTKISTKRLTSEVKKANQIIEAYTGSKSQIIRPPYGALNSKVKRVLMSDFKMDIIMWSVDPLDWKKPGAEVIARRLIEGAKPGAILLAHDIHKGTIDAIPSVLNHLLMQGYTFCTVGELLRQN